MMKTSSEIRRDFLDYFQGKGHTVVESSSLIPQNDPTLLFSNAGMVQFKGVFLGDETRKYKRAASSQKCLRAGGKHNDLENVGRTARHHTFFEMLGNFSFGDYFKVEAISMAWEFITGLMGISPDRLLITVYEEDNDAFNIWNKNVNVPSERIFRMGEKDNFWSMGDTGPCGPCSEILIDQGESFGCGRPECGVGCDCDRFLELWNLVFMQFNRDEKGNKTLLPRPSIDTGMGLERITAVLQNVKSNYDTDLFCPLLNFVEEISRKRYGIKMDIDTSMKIIADHSRAVAFLIADGVLPSNEGRGYVLRRIMRRAARHGRMLDTKDFFLHKSVGIVAEHMKAIYPELLRSLEYITRVVLNEEKAFSDTLESGLNILEDEIELLKKDGKSSIPGDFAFKLYDTYGFPLDLTADIALEQGLSVDQDGFEKAMQEQKLRARKAWKGSGDEKIGDVYKKIVQKGVKVLFNGYEKNDVKSRIQILIRNGEPVDFASHGEDIDLVAAETPFYGESGGQTGDRGIISGSNFTVEVIDTVKPLPELIVHKGKVLKGRVTSGDDGLFSVDMQKRRSTANNHTATHILHSVLRNCLGNHVTQAGSLVTSERLRFDFTHFEAIKKEELIKIEDSVNERIRENSPVDVKELSLQEARNKGATALFGEKYGEMVRVVTIAGYSMELCGGTHIHSTGDIGIFKIISEGAIAAGVRRIEALTGKEACRFIQKEEDILVQLSETLKSDTAGIMDKVDRLISIQKNMEKEIEKLKSQLISNQATSILDNTRDIAGVRTLITMVDVKDPKSLRSYGDKIKDKIGSGIIVFGAEDGQKVHLLSMVTNDISDRFSARRIIEEIAPLIGGKGGGKNDMAQAGGKDPGKLQEALEKAAEVIESMGKHC